MEKSTGPNTDPRGTPRTRFIPGYNMLRSDRTAASGKQGGGGILVYTRNHYGIQLVENSCICTPNIEKLWLKVNLKQSRPIYIACIYQPPDAATDASIRDLENMFLDIEIPSNADIICIGDFNIDDSKLNADKHKLHQFMRNHNMGQVITQLTRITPTTATIIDHVWCNN